MLDWLFVVRLVSAAILAVCSFQMVLLLSNSWHGVRPMRREIEQRQGVVFTTSWGLTFAYNCVVLGFLVSMTITRVQLAIQSTPINFATFATPPLAVAMCVVLSRIQHDMRDRMRRISRGQNDLGGTGSAGRGPANT